MSDTVGAPMGTVLITGCSSGFGLETARYFLDRQWAVVATMRNPREDLLPKSDRLRIVPLDVTDDESIVRVVAEAGDIDVLVNNAGVGMVNALEGVSMKQVREVIDTNTIGVIAMTKAVLPQFRARGSGVIVNVSSGVTMRVPQLMSIYAASKAAMNTFTEALALELEPFGIRTRLIIPGRSPAPDTAFSENVVARMGRDIPEPYAEMAQRMLTGMQGQPAENITRAIDVAEAVWRAVADPSCPMYLPAGRQWAASGVGRRPVPV